MKKILLADDDPAIRLLITATLRSDDYQIIEATDGQETLALARREVPDLILLDIGMPRIDGFEVCRRLKMDPVTSGIHVIVLTAWNQDTDRQKARDAGADEFFTKPFSPIALLEKVADALG